MICRMKGDARREAEKRLHRCCFMGHEPDRLGAPEKEVRAWLSARVDDAVADGYRTFICSCSIGVGIWAGQTVLRKREEGIPVRLICAVPWPGFPDRWTAFWQLQYRYLLEQADYVRQVSGAFHKGVFRERNEWMVNHSSRLIAWYNDFAGGTWDTIEYAVRNRVEVVSRRPEFVEEFREALEQEKRENPGMRQAGRAQERQSRG